VVRDAADDAQHHLYHRAVLADRHLRQFRHRPHLDQWRAGRSDPGLRHLAFQLGILSNDIPLGASVSLFMFPILGISAIFILRGVNKRGNEA